MLVCKSVAKKVDSSAFDPAAWKVDETVELMVEQMVGNMVEEKEIMMDITAAVLWV